MAVTDAQTLFDELRRRGFAIHLDPNKPGMVGFSPGLPDDLAERVREHKAGLIEAVHEADVAALRAWAEREVHRLHVEAEKPPVEPERPETPSQRRERLRRVWAAIDRMDAEVVA